MDPHPLVFLGAITSGKPLAFAYDGYPELVALCDHWDTKAAFHGCTVAYDTTTDGILLATFTEAVG